MLLSTFLSSLLLWFGTACPLMGFFCFHFLCAVFLEESFVVVSWWSYIVLGSAYHGSLLLLHLFWMLVFCIEYPSVEVICIHCPEYLTPCSSHFSIEKSDVIFDEFTFVCYLFFSLWTSIFFLYSLCLLF
jgi:hypothetical protein